jgi:hypothetical protein
MKHTDSCLSFSQFYDTICDKADALFRESNMCQWETNSDGTVSCITNRQNSKNRPCKFKETDGCCIELCKTPDEFSDSVIKRKQHSKKTGCLVKSLKCKLHICDFLIRESRNNACLKNYISELENLQKIFSGRYEKLWREMPYAASKAAYIQFFKRYYRK